MSNRQREERELARIRAAAHAASAASGSAMAAALAQIGAAFDEAAAVNRFKIRVERYIRLGPGHIALRARYGARAALLRGRGLDAAVVLVERWWLDERKAFAIASALGRGNRLSLEVLRELRLMLRLMRWKRMRADFGAIVTLCCSDDVVLAAAE
jgi:hypothetical protein